MTDFDRWTATASKYLVDYTGRSLADLPFPDAVLREWHGRGIPAQELAERLVPRAAKVRRWQIGRWYTDDPRRRVAEWRKV